MKIAIVHPEFSIKGGAENVIFWLAEDLVKKPEWEVTLFSVDFAECKGRLLTIAGLRLEEIYVPKLLRKFQLARLLWAPFFLKKRLKFYDVINPHNYPASVWMGLAYILSGKKLPRIIWSCNEPPRFLYKNICNEHTPFALQLNCSEVNDQMDIKVLSRIKIAIKEIYKPLLRFLDRLAVKQCGKIITLSKSVAQQVEDIYGAKNVEVCYLGIKEMDNGQEQTDVKGKYFLTVSRLEACKNIQNVIKAFAQLQRQKKIEGVQYYIIGTGPLQPYLENMIACLGLREKIHMPGFVSRQELLSYYRGCLAVIYLPFDEPFGLPYLEAAYFSKPALASAHGGPAELVKDGKTGLLVDPGNVEGIAAKIERFVADDSERNRMGRSAYEWYNKEFTWETYIMRYSKAIKNYEKINKCIFPLL